MRTYTNRDDEGRITGFDIDIVYLSLATICRVLARIDGVSEIRKRRPFSAFDEIHIRFRFHGTECVVWEPFGDNSRYYIGQEKTPAPVDLSALEQAFKNYEPPIHRKVIGDIVTLRFVQKLLGRDGDWRRVNPPPP